MPYSLNGCGTMFYGKRSSAEDGSYVTTLWVAFLWVPILPLRSYRVRPVGKGTNIVVHKSQNYLTAPVAFCWPQVLNIYALGLPILALMLFLARDDIRQWWQENVPQAQFSQSVPKSELPALQPIEEEVPLDTKAAAHACGKVLKIDKSVFEKLNMIPRLSQAVRDSEITDEELKEFGPSEEVEKQAFQAYSLAYLTWDKPDKFTEVDLEKMVVDSFGSLDTSNMSSTERTRLDAYITKFRNMELKAFEMGRHDARISPCPY